MKILLKKLYRLVILVLVVVPIIAWFFVKPVRLIAPGLFNIQCNAQGICAENAIMLKEAATLHNEAIRYLAERITPLDAVPQVIYCSTERCADTFGLGKRSAVTFGRLGTVIGPRAWKPYYVRHELIHQLQAQELGVLKCLISPSWLIEGMAYSLSGDPREPLSQPWEKYRKRFAAWYARVGAQNMWEEAAETWRR